LSTDNENGLRIVGARNSLFEVDIDLGCWADTSSSGVDSFSRHLTEVLPSLWEHKCMLGQPGGFVEELRQGTHLAHVVEHVLLELLHLADPAGRTYTGWTNPKTADEGTNEAGVYTVHFQIRSSSQGLLAARAGLAVVEDLLYGRTPDVQGHINRLKETFTCDQPEK
jgi:cyanophycin synthetase